LRPSECVPVKIAALLLLLTGSLAAQDAARDAANAEPGDAPPAPTPSRQRPVTISDAVDLALAYNIGLESERLGVLIARLRVDEEEAAWDTVFNSGVGGGEDRIPSRTELAGADVLDTDRFHFNFGLEKRLPVGPTLGVNWRTDRTFNNSSFATINPAYDSAFEFTISVPLWRGRGRGVTEVELRAERHAMESARQDLMAEIATLLTSVGSAYWELVNRQERVKVLEKSLDVAREIEASERKKLRPEVGRSTIIDVTKAEAETQRRIAELIVGRRDAADAADALRELILPFTGEKDLDELVFIAIDEPQQDLVAGLLDDRLATAMASRPELRAQDASIARLQEFVVQARDAVSPELNLTGAVTSRGVASGFDNSAGDVFARDAVSASGELNLSFPFGRRAAKAALRRSELELERARLTRRELSNGIIAEVRRAHRAVSTAGDQINASRKEVESAEVALDGERRRLARGTSTLINVVRLEEDLTLARIRLLEARIGLERARLELLRVEGTILERFSIGIDEELRARRAVAPAESAKPAGNPPGSS